MATKTDDHNAVTTDKQTRDLQSPDFQAHDFHAHDHTHCQRTALERAHTLCRTRKLRLTPQRERVLTALLDNHKAVSAYDIMDKLVEDGRRPAPISVYRALEFLVEQGLAHRIESRNAYIACCHDHTNEAALVFFLCEACGAVGESHSPGLKQALDTLAADVAFSASQSVLEIKGVCGSCQETITETGETL